MQNLTLDGQVSFQSISNIQDSSSSVNIPVNAPASTMKELNKCKKNLFEKQKSKNKTNYLMYVRTVVMAA